MGKKSGTAPGAAAAGAGRAGSSAGGRIAVGDPPSPLKQSPFAALAARTLEQTPSAKTDDTPATAAPPAPTAAASAPAAPAATKPRSLGRLILRRETKHRGGKAVVIVSGFRQQSGASAAGLPLHIRLREVEKLLKAKLGCGGSSDVESGEVLIQGDRPAEVAELLRELGYSVAGVTEKPRG